MYAPENNRVRHSRNNRPYDNTTGYLNLALPLQLPTLPIPSSGYYHVNSGTGQASQIPVMRTIPFNSTSPSVTSTSDFSPSPEVDPLQLHKVWIVDCKSCGTFLTNRGMKAVLLLHPNVPLFSTDAMPRNCSVYSPNPFEDSQSAREVGQQTRTHAASSRRQSERSRTCECLTQTLSCHGCGTHIGYMIAIPCSRCTSSTYTSPQAFPPHPHASGNFHLHPAALRPTRPRITNGHRFVFHSSQVVGEERLYIEEEPGIIEADDNPTSEESLHFETPSNISRTSSPSAISPHLALQPEFPPPPLSMNSTTFSYASGNSAASPQTFPHTRDRFGSNYTSDDDNMPYNIGEGSSMQSNVSERMGIRHHTPESRTTSRRPPAMHTMAPTGSLERSELPSNHNASYSGRDDSFPPLASFPSLFPVSYPKVPRLKAGDVLYWHHLVNRGELPSVYDDERARASLNPSSTGSSDASNELDLPVATGAFMDCAR